MATEIKKIISRRDTAAKWEANNPILAQGEIGVDTTNKVMKIGDGVTPWKSLKGVGVTDIVQETGTSEDKVMSQNAVTQALKNAKPDIINDLTTGGADKALSAEIGKELQTITDFDSGYISTEGSVGSSVDVSVIQHDLYFHKIIPCCEGMTFSLIGSGGGAPRLWCFLDKDLKIISNSDKEVTMRGEYIVAPSDTAYMIYNSIKKFSTVYNPAVILASNIKAISSIRNRIAQIHKDMYDKLRELTDTMTKYELTNGYIAEGEPVVLDVTPHTTIQHVIINCVADQKFYILGTTGSTTRLYRFIDANNNVLLSSGLGEDSTEQGLTVEAPEGSCKLIINIYSSYSSGKGVWRVESDISAVSNQLQNRNEDFFASIKKRIFPLLDITSTNIDLDKNIAESKRYINSSGNPITYDSAAYCYSKRIKLKRGDVISVVSYGTASVAVLSLWNGTKYNVLKLGNSAIQQMEYRAVANCEVAVSWNINYAHLCHVYSTDRTLGSSSLYSMIPTQLNIAYSSIGIAPINTEEHFLTAVKLGFNALKTDIAVTSDGELICCHDAGFTFDENGRITTYSASNSTNINTLTLEQVMSYEYEERSNLLGYYSRVCTIDKYLRICREYGKIPYITVRSVDMDVIIPKLKELLHKWNFEAGAIVNKYPWSISIARNIRTALPNIGICYTATDTSISVNSITEAMELGNLYVCVEVADIASLSTQIDFIKNNNVPLLFNIPSSYATFSSPIGFNGGQISAPILDYSPNIYSFRVYFSGGVAHFSNKMYGSKYTADVSCNEDYTELYIYNVKLNQDVQRDFPDGIMPIWLNYLPYTLSVRADNNGECDVVWRDNKIVVRADDVRSTDYIITLIC